MQYEPEYKKRKDGTYDTSKVKSIKVFFVKTKDDDNADSLLKHLGFKSDDKGYGDMKSQIEGAISNMTTSEMGTTGILASSLKGSVGGVNIGGAFTTIGNLLGEQANYDASHPGNYSSKDSKGPSSSNHDYGDCTETTARLSFGVPRTDSLASLGTQDGPTGMDERFIGSASPQNGNLRLLDAIRYNGNGNSVNRHYMSVVFTGDDGTTQAFSRSGNGGRFEVIRADAFNGSSYGNIGGTSTKHSGFYRR